MSDIVSFGEWIKRRRRALDLTQDELARRVSCSLSLIRMIEADGRRPSRQIAERLADELGLVPEEKAAFVQAARGQLGAFRLASPTQSVVRSPLTPAPSAAETTSAPSPLPAEAARPALDGIITSERPLHIQLLGRFHLKSGPDSITAVNTPRLQALLAYLVLHRDVPQSRQSLAFLLWPDTADAQARSNLRTLLHRLRAALPQAHTFLSLDEHTVCWRTGPAFTFDVAEFEAALKAAGQAEQGGDEAQTRAELERAVELYQGDLFPDCYDDWVLPERERLRHLAIEALERLVALRERRGEHAAAIERARRLRQLDPLREATYLSLMRLHAAQGERAGALRIYHSYASLLRDELAVEPGPTMRAAYEQLVASDVPPLLTATTPVTTSPLVGRKTEQARAHAIWQTAANGRPLMLALTGEAGLGKTRLAMEVLAWAGRQGVATAIAQCYAAEGDLAYAPVTAWLRSEAIRPRLAQLASVWLTEVARLAPEVLAGRPDAANPRPLTERWQRQRLFEALARAMLTGDRPLLLLIDDLPWCDRDTLEWLHFLLRYAPRARLLVLATLRPEEAGPDHPLVALMNDLRRSGQLTEMALMPLSPAETAELAEYLAGRTLAGGEASGLYAETEGNPLFVLETLRAGWAVQSAGAGPDTESPTETTTVPPGVQSVIAQRLWQLTPEARELLGVASVMGRSFNFRVLERAGGVAEAVLVRGLDELWQRRIVREQGTEAYDFSHDLLRQVVYSQLSPVRRRVLHRHVAEALEAEHASNLEAIGGQLAAHYEHAGDGERAATYYEKAADAAQRVYANAEATGHLRRALKLLAPLTEPDQGARSAALAERLGDLLHLSGQYAEAREAYQHGLELVASERRQERANLRRKIGNVWRDQYCYDEAFGAYAAALAELSLSSDVARPELWQSWIQIQMDRFQTHYWLAQVPEMFGLVEALRPAVERYGSPLQRARISQMLWFASLRRDRTGSDEAVKYSAGYLEEVQAAGASDALPAARFQHGMALFLRGDLDLAEQEMLTALEVAQKKHDVSLEARCLTYLTIISRQRQRVEAVRDYAERSLLVATLVQMPDYIGAAAGNRAWIAWRSGDLDQAYAHGQQALTEWSQTRLYFSAQWTALWPLLAVALARGNIPEAVTYARALLDPKQYLQPQVLEAALTKAIHSVDAGDEAAARTALEGAQSPAVALGYL